MYRLSLLVVLAACVPEGDLVDDAFTDELLDDRTEVAAETPDLAATGADLLPGLRAAAVHTRAEVAQALGEEAAEALPDLVALAQASTHEEGSGGLREGPLCRPSAVIGGAWTLDTAHAGSYVGAWFRPDGTPQGGLAGHFRDLARPGGQWGGFFGHDGQPVGPQGGMFDRHAERFAGLWSTPGHQGGVRGHWVRLTPEGGFFFGRMAACGVDGAEPPSEP